jgi:effector-binding domain-containing protein
MMEIVLVEVPAMNVLGTRKTGTYALIPELIRKVFAYIQKKKALPARRISSAMKLTGRSPGGKRERYCSSRSCMAGQ